MESQAAATTHEVDAWLQAIANIEPPLAEPDSLIAALAGALRLAGPSARLGHHGRLTEFAIDQLEIIYRRLDLESLSRGAILRLLATDGGAAALARFAELVATAPPATAPAAAIPFAALLQLKEFDANALFPRLLKALAYPQTAALVLDVANYWTRQGLLAAHPAADRVATLSELLGDVIQRLTRIEEGSPQTDRTLTHARQTVEESVSLCVSLCDSLGLIGDPRAVGKLRSALEIGHRRLRVEAAAALARLGDSTGFDALVELAADPASRTRALAYLEELSTIDRAASIHRAPAARAAAQLSDWLAEPAQFGAPPHNIRAIDARRMYWPGYDEPVDCRLFVYEYRARNSGLSGVGIVGPVTFSLAADLEDLSPDDIYAAFAGWQAEHQEIFESPIGELPPAEQAMYRGEAARCAGEEYQDIELVAVGHFFDDRTLIATARQGDRRGVLMVEAGRTEWYPVGHSRRPLGVTEAYFIHKGRKLLSSFNPHGSSLLDEADEAHDAL
jgi:hypothetical protein